MSEIDNTFVKLRARLRELDIKLWEEPYYYEEVGSIESEMDRLSEQLSGELGISVSNCKCALVEMQDSALRKLMARKEFNETGMATFSVRCVDSKGGTVQIIEIKCSLNALGLDLQQEIANRLKLSNARYVKCISAGRIVSSNSTLNDQGLNNNQQLIVIIGSQDSTNSSDGNAERGSVLYERIAKIKADIEAVVDADSRFFEMEDQDGNAVFLPPHENRSLLMAMGLCEKARAAMGRENYDEALLLLLEADEHFSICSSQFLESIDNYALLNLDIVWCYLCLKNVTQLPDAQRRLDICERNFERNYGKNLKRLQSLRGSSCPERALIVRLHLLQGVIFFHQNRRDEAYEKFEQAGQTLAELRVDDDQLTRLIEMGYDVADARLALRSCSGDADQAINFINNRREKLNTARKTAQTERLQQNRLAANADQDWVNPRSVCQLTEMGYERCLVVEALKRSKNDIPGSVDLLQFHADELRANVQTTPPADEQLLNILHQLGFPIPLVRVALETTQNDMKRAVEFLLKSQSNENQILKIIETMAQTLSGNLNDQQQPTSSSNARPYIDLSSSKMQMIETFLTMAKSELESYKAYKRFNEDVTMNDNDYLDLPLIQEEQILIEYKHLLER
ncbi:NEDD8 ultimate buster 1 [Drosophila tropicalis]|uniref:NEDD8 ultimate buster 1 n=1 Tax=Drosophila tropicalis TaxID=46794 RepID=UPI0035ABE7F0